MAATALQRWIQSPRRRPPAIGQTTWWKNHCYDDDDGAKDGGDDGDTDDDTDDDDCDDDESNVDNHND